MIESPKHLQVFEPGQVFIDGGILAGQTYARAQRIGVFDDIKPCHLCSPGIRT